MEVLLRKTFFETHLLKVLLINILQVRTFLFVIKIGEFYTNQYPYIFQFKNKNYKYKFYKISFYG